MKKLVKFNETPIEPYKINGKTIYVKREDLCADYPMPPLSKMRGVFEHLKTKKGLLGCIDTRVSKSGQGIAAICKELGLFCNYYFPQCKDEDILKEKEHIKIAKELGANIFPMKASRLSIVFSRSKRHVESNGGKMLPVGLPFYETVLETAKIIKETDINYLNGTIVLATGTGTILSGIVSGLMLKNIEPKKIVGISAGMSIKKQKKMVITQTNRIINSERNDLMDKLQSREKILRIVELYHSHRSYYEHSPVKMPFPFHNVYEGKALEWLENNIQNLEEPILFWNIGS